MSRLCSERSVGQSVATIGTATQTNMVTIRKLAAVETAMPMPVAAAKYIAKQAGHFGISTKATPGTSQRMNVP